MLQGNWSRRSLKLQLDEDFLIEGGDIGIACVEVG